MRRAPAVARVDAQQSCAGETPGRRDRSAWGLVRDTAIPILDEPTAALDPEVETTLVRSLAAVLAGRLVVVIAHRLSAIQKADRILFLEGGRICDVGSHGDLMADPAERYRHFVRLQTPAPLP